MKVWTLIFENTDFADCNGVFTTKEKAKSAFDAHAKDCEFWLTPEIVEEGDDFMIIEFFYQDDDSEGYELCYITAKVIDEI